MNMFKKLLLMALLAGYSCTVVFAHKGCDHVHAVETVAQEPLISIDSFANDLSAKAKQFVAASETSLQSIEEIQQKIDAIVKKALDEQKKKADTNKKMDKAFYVELYEKIIAEIRSSILDSTGKIIKTSASVISLIAGISLAISFILVLDDYTGCISAYGKYVLIPLVSRGAEVLQRVAQISVKAVLSGTADATGIPFNMLIVKLNALTNATGGMVASLIKAISF